VTDLRWYRWNISKYRDSNRVLAFSCLGAHGAYRNLLDSYMQKGKLPKDRRALWKLALASSPQEYEQVADEVEALFIVSDCGQYLLHDTANAELEYAVEKMGDLSAKRSQAGSNGAAKRWQADGKPIAKPQQTIAHNTTLQDTTVQESKPTATRLPNDFKVTPDHRFFALENDLPSPDDHIAEFRDYWIAKPGVQGKKLDWDATFRNWLRRAKQYKPTALGGANGGTRASQRQKSSFDAIRAAVDRANERATGNGNGSHEGSLHQPGSAGGDSGRDDAGLESPDSGVRRKEVQASVTESSPTLQVLPNHSRDKGVLRSGIERIPAPVGSG
jgi:uncharacterized protein YdaU (DUF1376 family)